MTERASELIITLAQLNPTVGDVEGNAAKARAARARAQATAPIWSLLPNCSSPVIRRRIWLLKPRVPGRPAARQSRALALRNRRWRPGDADRQPWVEEGKLLITPAALLEGVAHRAIRYKGEPAELRRVRREAPCSRAGRRGPGDGARRAGSAFPSCEDIWLRRVSEDYEKRSS